VWRVLSVLENVKVEGSIGKEWITQIQSNGNVVSSKLGTPSDHIYEEFRHKKIQM
jgi:hypothetical protein